MKVCLVGSSGGHLTHLYMLKPFWKKKDRFQRNPGEKEKTCGLFPGLCYNKIVPAVEYPQWVSTGKSGCQVFWKRSVCR